MSRGLPFFEFGRLRPQVFSEETRAIVSLDRDLADHPAPILGDPLIEYNKAKIDLEQRHKVLDAMRESPENIRNPAIQNLIREGNRKMIASLADDEWMFDPVGKNARKKNL